MGPGLLIIAHLDTVHPVGTLDRTLPIRREGDRCYGPGIYDMKAGTVMALTALEAVIAADALDLPVTVDLLVTQTDPGFAGDTATGAKKAATLETGLVVQVPLFVNGGDTLRIDTRNGEYVTRLQ